MPEEMSSSDALQGELLAIVARYPRPRSALMPMLHLVQSAEGHLSDESIETVAALGGVTPAEANAVASFYTMYVRQPQGRHHIGVCTNTLCAILGGDALWSALTEHVGVGSGGTTPDGRLTIERIECQAACTHAPVLTANWEFVDNVTIERAKEIADTLRADGEVASTRGPDVVRPLADVRRVFAGFDDGLAGEGGSADAIMRAGTDQARQADTTKEA
jgi:NADH-quinone oxidoreductase subunit E